MLKLLGIIAILAALAAPKQARADALVFPLTDNIKCSPVGMMTGWQYNTSTKIFQKGVALGLGYGCRYTGSKVPLALNLVGGAGVNDNAPNAGQGSLILTVADNFGVGGGLQVFKDPVSGDRQFQGLISFFVGASWAATMEQLTTAKANAARAATAGKLTESDFR